MVKVRLTALGKLFFLLILVFYLAAMTSQSGLLLLLIGLFAAALTLNYFICRRAVRYVEVQAPHETFLEEGEKLNDPWKVWNKGRSKAQLIELHSPAGLIMRLAEIPGQEFIARVPPLVFNRRGIFQNSDVTISSIAPFGLFRARRETGLPGRTVVFPKLYDVESPPAASLDRMAGGKLSGSQRVTSGMSFAGVRQWQGGDPFRNIHWKSTATQRKLMVKLFDEELSGRIAIYLRVAQESGNALESSIRAAGSLAFAALDDGHQVEFLDSTAIDPLSLAPFSATEDLLLRLAGIVPSKEKVLPEPSESLSRKAALCLVLPGLEENDLRMIETAAEHNRKVLVFVPVGVHVPGDTPARVFFYAHDRVETAPMRAGFAK